MRKFLKSAGLPIGVFALAIGSAFATNAMKSSTTTLVPSYYYQNPDRFTCEPIADNALSCSEINTGMVCTWTDPSSSLTHQVFDKELDVNNQLVCTKVLYRIP